MNFKYFIKIVKYFSNNYIVDASAFSVVGALINLKKLTIELKLIFELKIFIITSAN